jgi:peptidoglycan-associated lipoprotein
MTISEELIQIGDRVLFGFDSYELTSDAKSILDNQASFLASNPSVRITIEGHCDERGTREYNLALGESRASATRDYLVAQGVNPARIKIISYGKERPAVIGSNEDAWRFNRRAVSVIN